jgi:hypothetical protein
MQRARRNLFIVLPPTINIITGFPKVAISILENKAYQPKV